MIELDYAFLADYARVESNGTLTVIGASWTFIVASQVPAVHRMAIAGRIRSTPEAEPVPLRIEVVAPEGKYRMALNAELTRAPAARPYGAAGRVGHLFAVDMDLPLPVYGLYEVHIHVADRHARRLAFDVVEGPAAVS